VPQFHTGSQDTAVGTGTGHNTVRPGFDSWQGQEIPFYCTASRPDLGPTQPPKQQAPGALSSKVNRPGREVDHSPPSSAEVKNGGAIPSLPNTSSWSSA
jgi:hypothetical protein